MIAGEKPSKYLLEEGGKAILFTSKDKPTIILLTVLTTDGKLKSYQASPTLKLKPIPDPNVPDPVKPDPPVVGNWIRQVYTRLG